MGGGGENIIISRGGARPHVLLSVYIQLGGGGGDRFGSPEAPGKSVRHRAVDRM